MSALHVARWGDGDRTAVLLHGLSGSSAGWWRIGPELAERGYRVLAPDVSGHGGSPRAGRYSRERWAAELLDTLPAAPDLAIGHSLGGVLLAMIVERLRPTHAVYEDPAWYPWSGVGYGEAGEMVRTWKTWTEPDLRRAFPQWTDDAVRARLAAFRDWDPDTTRMDFLETAYVPVFPVVPSLVLRAETGDMVAPPFADHLRRVGFDVRTVPGTGHTVHMDNPDGFLAALDDWLAVSPPVGRAR